MVSIPWADDAAKAADATQRRAAPRCRIWAAQPERFSTQRISPVRHDYHLHPLLQLPALAELADALVPQGQCRFLRPGTTQDSLFDHDPHSHDGRRVDEVFRHIEEPGSWVALYNIETVPSYRALLDEILASAAPLYQHEQHDLFNVGGFVFISAPPSVTPFHIDRENNFWLQLHGRKTINVWDRDDRDVVPAAEVERFIVHRALSGVRLKDEVRSRSLEFDTGPGDGVYFPSTTPHMTRTDESWVRPGAAVSVSIGVVFYSRETRHAARVHYVNELLRRRMGLAPRYPGASPWRDSLKAALARALIAARARLHGTIAAPGIE